MKTSFAKTSLEPLKKKSNITLLIISFLLISIPIVGFLSLKHKTGNNPNIFEYFYQTNSPQEQSTHYNIQIVYGVNHPLTPHPSDSSTNQ
ncbi:MAG: hypothetical protein ACP5F6_01080 [Microbacter sp.]